MALLNGKLLVKSPRKQRGASRDRRHSRATSVRGGLAATQNRNYVFFFETAVSGRWLEL